MRDIEIIFVADVLDNLALQDWRDLRYLPGLGVHAGIVDGDHQFEMPEVGTGIALDDVQPVRGWMAREIEPGLAVESDSIDDQFVALPMADGVAVPRGVEIFRVPATV